MRIGLVSNVFGVQLGAGQPLDDLVGESQRRGYDVIELRQGSLGSYESAARIPDVDALGRLAERFREVRFIPAFEVPFLDPTVGPHDEAFAAAAQLAVAVAGPAGERPHLRLVDTVTTPEEAGAAEPAGGGASLAGLARALLDVDGVLSVENARQPWTRLQAVVAAARQQLGADSAALRLCFDPCNLSWIGDDPTSPVDAMASLSADQIGMIHFKQHIDGAVDPLVGSGALDWRELIETMGRRRLFQQSLFEMAPAENLWSNLTRSAGYLRRIWKSRVAEEPWGTCRPR